VILDKRFYLPASVFVSCVLLLIFGFSHARFVGNFVNSDELLPADWTRHIFHDGYPPFGFQLPRTPGIFPDLLLFAPIQIITGSWRIAIFGLAICLLVALIGAAAMIVGRISGIPASRAIASCWIIVFPLLLVELAHSGAGRHFNAIQPVSHGGVFIASLWAAVLSERLRRAYKSSVAILLCILCGLAVLSDKLFIFTFTIPLACALFCVPTDVSVRRKLLLLVALGSALGWLCAEPINRQADIPLDWSFVADRIGIFLRDIDASILLGTLAPVLLLIAAPIVARRFLSGLFSGDAARFYWVFAVTAIAGTIGLTAAFLYEDRGSYRYLETAIWWPAIFAAAPLAVLLERRPPLTMALPSAILTVSVAMVLYSGVAPADSLWHWQHPVARCLLERDIELRNGLAGYWQARPMEISSDFRLQVDPLQRNGEIYHWGNDLLSYAAGHFDRWRRPDYRFIVMDGLDPAAIANSFGKPAEVLACAGTDVWIYSERLVPSLSQQLQ
jgi:hypothetical protein